MFEAGDQGLMRNPDIASSFTRDVYVSPVAVDQMGSGGGADEETYTLRKGEASSIGQVQATFIRFDMSAHGQDAMANASKGMSVGSVLELNKGKERETIIPSTVYRPNAAPVYTTVMSRLLQAPVKLVSMNVGMGPGQSAVTVSVQRSGTGTEAAETLIVEASVKPLIGFVWAGTLLLTLGFIISIIKRTKDT
jgi:cytochrome c biogenesis factor